MGETGPCPALRAEPGLLERLSLDPARLPRHVAVIMDGNGRWARQRGLPRPAGHRAGVEAVRRVVEAASRLGIPYLTLYAFSTENWRRPRAEVRSLMNLLVEAMQRYLRELDEKGVRVRVIGEVAELPPGARAAVEEAQRQTAGNEGLQLTFAINYGGRREIVEAARTLMRRAAAGEMRPEDLDEEGFARCLYTHDIPDPDLLIRPSGEMRISNFLLWQMAYAEIWVTPVLWPDFDLEELVRALRSYQARERRFGGLAGADARAQVQAADAGRPAPSLPVGAGGEPGC